MKVRVLTTLKTARGITPAGSIIDIPDNLLVRLRGKVAPLHVTEPDLHRILVEGIAEIDRQGRPWTGWRKSLTDDQWQAVKAAEQMIDHAFETLEWDDLMAALAAYRKATIEQKNQNPLRSNEERNSHHEQI